MTAPVVWRPARQAFAQGSFGVAPITLADLKAHARIDAADEDAGVTSYLAAAAGRVERLTGRLLTERAVTLALPSFPPLAAQEIALPGGRCAAVASVAYVDAGDAALTLAAEDWWLDAVSAPARLGLAGGALWPVTRPWGLPVTIGYTAGYADGAQPPDLLAAVMVIATEMYEQRRAAVIGASVGRAMLDPAALIEPWKIVAMF